MARSEVVIEVRADVEGFLRKMRRVTLEVRLLEAERAYSAAQQRIRAMEARLLGHA